MATINEISWNVKSQSVVSNFYSVQKTNDKCVLPDHCNIKCTLSDCVDLCYCMYTCSCADSAALCKHIHRIHSKIRYDFSSIELSSSLSIADQTIGITCERKTQTNKSLYELINKEYQKLGHYVVKRYDNANPSDLRTILNFFRECNIMYECIENETQPSISTEIKSISSPVQQMISPHSKLPTTPLKLYKTRKEYGPSKKLKIKHDLSFTPPITKSTNLKQLFRTQDNVSFELYELKSLDTSISNEEVEIIRTQVPNFNRGWLYDNIIDIYLKYLISDLVPRYQHVQALECYKVELIYRNQDEKDLQKIVGRLSQNNPDTRILFLPFNPTRQHWILVVLNLLNNTAMVLDPLVKARPSNAQDIERFINTCAKLWSPRIPFKVEYPDHILQTDMYNCGVYICYYVERIVTNQSLDELIDTIEYRKIMYRTIIRGTSIENQ